VEITIELVNGGPVLPVITMIGTVVQITVIAVGSEEMGEETDGGVVVTVTMLDTTGPIATVAAAAAC
jgi:hypothetical protein